MGTPQDVTELTTKIHEPSTTHLMDDQDQQEHQNDHQGGGIVEEKPCVSPTDLDHLAPSHQTTSVPSTPRVFIPHSVASNLTRASVSHPARKSLSILPDSSTDHVFPIRSVVSVDPSPTRSSINDHESSCDTNARAIAIHGFHFPKTLSSGHAKSDKPLSVNPAVGAQLQNRRKSSLCGPLSSIQVDSARKGSAAPIHIELNISDDDRDVTPSPGDSALSTLQTSEAARQSSARDDEQGSISLSSPVSQRLDPLESHFTTRFTHIETEDGHSVITGRDGTLQRCEDEPIHAPGAVQGFGALVALREENDGSFVVRYVSENSDRVLGYSPRKLFKLASFMDILTEEQQDNLLDHIDFIRDEDADPVVNGPEVFSLSIRQSKQKTIKLWCAIHINTAHPDLVICEFELDDDPDYPLRPAGESTPDEPHNTLQSNPTREEIEESTEILSKPLRILRSARKRRGEQGVMQVFDIMSQVQEQLASAINLDTFLKILVGIVKELTGFHRVMIYQFDAQFNGKVITELVDPVQTRDLYHGLNFPASDIPRQARELYKLNKVRLLYDCDLQTARLVCRAAEDLETPLDMSHAYLRAISPIHLKYLKNMAVRSSMSISINAFDELWGLIACHSYGNEGMRVSFPIRKMCRLVGDIASRNIERLSYASRLQARKLINTTPTDSNPSGYIIASSDDLLRLFDADFGLLSIQGETKIMGVVEQTQEALAMLEYLKLRKLTSVVASQDIRLDFPDLVYPPGFQVISGLLYVPLSVGGGDFIVFFRKGQAKEVKWAGNPYEKTIRDGTSGYLEPRKSFKTWYETVIGKCRDWNEEQVETAAVLCLVYGKFIEVWRQKEAALQNSRLTKLLIANSAHEVRTPLNAIINYLEIALEGSLDKETRDNLAKSHSASKSLIYVINDLLDLTKTEEGKNLIKDEIFELPACIREATEPFQNDVSRKGVEYDVYQDPELPRFVYGDGRRLRQALSNMMANAIAHTDEGFIKVEALVSEVKDNQVTVEFIFQDSGVGISPQRLDALFRDLEQVSTEEPHTETTVETAAAEETEGSGSAKRTLGLGLAFVARIVRTMNGQLRLKSEQGEGSRFVLQLPFQVPDSSEEAAREGHASPHGSINSMNSMNSANSMSSKGSKGSKTQNPDISALHTVLKSLDGERVLVHGSSSVATSVTESERRNINAHGNSQDRRSDGSYGSWGSQYSDADRLIDAIQSSFSSTQPDLKHPDKRSGHSVTKYPSSYGRKQHKSPKPATQRQSKAGKTGCTSHDQKWQTVSPKTNDEQTNESSDQILRGSSGPEFVPDFNNEAFTTTSSAPTQPSSESVTSGGTIDTLSLQVLIAEDDPINMKIMTKRLQKAGHGITHAVNGHDCATTYKDQAQRFDVVLMDMQMPIMDGLASTKMIRSFEQLTGHEDENPRPGAISGRVPIIAVSASLVEIEKQKYVDAGFDGWILKPIDFKRLNILLRGIHEDEIRTSCAYVPGQWERGGWFCTRGDEILSNEAETPKAGVINKQLGHFG